MLAILASGAIDLVPNPLFIFIQLIVYLLVVFLLKRYVFDPILEVLRLRSQMTAEKKQNAIDMSDESAQIESELSARIQSERESLAKTESEKRKSTELEARELVQKSKERAQAEYEAARKEQGEFISKTSKDLESQIPALTEMLVERATQEETKGRES